MLIYKPKKKNFEEDRCQIGTNITRQQMDRFIELFGNGNKSQVVRTILLKAILEKEKEVFNLQQKETDAKINI
jgi:Mn-dependent DtxR family transcriptional regulator